MGKIKKLAMKLKMNLKVLISFLTGLLSLTTANAVTIVDCNEVFNGISIPATWLIPGPSETIIRTLGSVGGHLKLDSHFYDQHENSAKKASHYSGLATVIERHYDHKTEQIPVYIAFEVGQTNNANLFVTSTNVPDGIGKFQDVPLQFFEMNYNSATPNSRTKIYAGDLLNSDGSKSRIFVRVMEHNIEPNTRRVPQWEFTGEATLENAENDDF